MQAEPLALSSFQQRALAVPEAHDLFLGGGRGGGKSFLLAVLAMRHCEQYRERARVLYLRLTYKGLADFENLTRELFARVYGSSARFNASEHVWRLPNGGYFELGQLEGWADYPKYQGRSFTLLLVDEAGQYAEPATLDRLRSNLRGPADLPLRMVMAANPGDVGHSWLAQRYVFREAPWVPFLESKSGRTWVSAPSTYVDNDFIDQAGYQRQLESSCPGDPEMLRAWGTGDWTVAKGAFFGSVLEESRVAVDPWHPEAFAAWRTGAGTIHWNPQVIPGTDWLLFLAHDFGVTAPAVTLAVARSEGGEGPDGRTYPRGSLVIFDELHTAEPGSWTKGLGYTVPRLAEEIRGFAGRWGLHPDGVADDAIFARTGSGAGSIGEELRAHGVFFRPAGKADRKTGWERVRALFAGACRPDVPGLYIARHCEGCWATIPTLPRDPRRPDDVDSRGADHWADALRYAVVGQRAGEAATVTRPW